MMGTVEHFLQNGGNRPRPLDGSGNSVIPAASVLNHDIMGKIGKLFMNMQTQERLQQVDLETYEVDSETDSESG
jgi:hypothetical protein